MFSSKKTKLLEDAKERVTKIKTHVEKIQTGKKQINSSLRIINKVSDLTQRLFFRPPNSTYATKMKKIQDDLSNISKRADGLYITIEKFNKSYLDNRLNNLRNEMNISKIESEMNDIDSIRNKIRTVLTAMKDDVNKAKNIYNTVSKIQDDAFAKSTINRKKLFQDIKEKKVRTKVINGTLHVMELNDNNNKKKKAIVTKNNNKKKPIVVKNDKENNNNKKKPVVAKNDKENNNNKKKPEVVKKSVKGVRIYEMNKKLQLCKEMKVNNKRHVVCNDRNARLIFEVTTHMKPIGSTIKNIARELKFLGKNISFTKVRDGIGSYSSLR